MTTSKTPLVSIGLPVYNREALIPKTLESLLAQTFTDFEIIISDNGSTDGTEAVCRQYAANDARIRYIRQPRNLGLLGNFNFVMKEARGKYFMWTASDDMCEKEFVGKLVEQLERDPELALVMADLKYISESGQPVKVNKLDSIRIDDVNADWESKRLLFFQYPGHKLYDCFYGMYRTEIVQSCHLPEHIWKNLVFSLEVPFLAQVAVKGKIASIDAPLKLYRYYANSSYMKEASSVKLIDKVVRGSEIWWELFVTAISSRLDWKTRVGLVLKAAYSSAKYAFAAVVPGHKPVVDVPSA
ncbi:MAG: glycosyltransferase family 2 protein [Thiothrix sp.]